MFNVTNTPISKDIPDRLELLGAIKYRVKELLSHDLFEVPRDKHHPFWVSEDSETEARLHTMRFQIESLHSRVCDICESMED